MPEITEEKIETYTVNQLAELAKDHKNYYMLVIPSNESNCVYKWLN